MPRDRTPEEWEKIRSQIPAHGGRYRAHKPDTPDVPRIPQIHQEYQTTGKTWKHIYIEAMNKNEWIFIPAYKEWLSPQEFKDRYERYSVADLNFFDLCKVLHPTKGLKAADKMILDLQNKRDDLFKRMVVYYTKKK